MLKVLIRLATIEHQTDAQGCNDEWKVYLGGVYIGCLHMLDGSIGGTIGEFDETQLFDYVCDLAEVDYKYRK